MDTTNSGYVAQDGDTFLKDDQDQELQGQEAYATGHDQDKENAKNEDQQVDNKLDAEYQSQINQ